VEKESEWDKKLGWRTREIRVGVQSEKINGKYNLGELRVQDENIDIVACRLVARQRSTNKREWCVLRGPLGNN
jgi:hypothetical protein